MVERMARTSSSKPGKLVVVATPIGNLADISLRALDALDAADVIYAEDTRVTAKLLKHHGIDTPLERCDENVIRTRATRAMIRIAAGQTIAFVSDAGTPGISDPGMVLVQAAQEADIDVEVIPGASAVLTALVASGVDCSRFYFGGFLPRKAGERAKLLKSLAGLDAALVFYESPHRSAASLKSIAQVFPERDCVLARELTKLHEEVLRLPAPELAAQVAERESLKGEVVLVIAPPSVDGEPEEWDEETVRAFAAELEGSRSAKAKQIAERFGMTRSAAYDLLGSNED